MTSREPRDLIGAVEAAYDLGASWDGWLQGLADAVVPLLGPRGGAAYLLDQNKSGQLRLSNLAAFTDPLDAVDDIVSDIQVTAGVAIKTPEWATMMVSGPCFSMAELFPGADRNRYIGPHGRDSGVEDFVIVIAAQPSLPPIIIGVAQDKPWHATAALKRRWGRVAAHIGAGRRLRTRATPCALDPGPDEAVLEANGRIAHADGHATSKSAREHLRQSAHDLDRARGSLRREPDQALGLWQGLVSGRWSLVDQFDTDGRRYIVARRNEPCIGDPRSLTPRECAVARYAALGQSDKLIGYSLGLSTSTVATHLRGALRKLGVASRVELVQNFGREPLDTADAPSSSAVAL